MMLTRGDVVRQLAATSAGMLAARPAFAAADTIVRIANVPIEPTADVFYADEQGFAS